MENSKTLIVQQLAKFAVLLEKQVDKAIVLTMADIVISEGLDNIMLSQAITHYLKSCLADRFSSEPFSTTVAKLIEICKPRLNVANEAVLISSAIKAAIKGLGFYAKPDELSARLGPIGLKIVCDEGGWQNLCETTLDSEIDFKVNRWQKLAKVYLQSVEQNKFLELNGAPERKQIE